MIVEDHADFRELMKVLFDRQPEPLFTQVRGETV